MKKIKPPNKETVASQSYQYIDLPRSMDECYYELELVNFKLSDDESKYFATFKVTDTDTKVRVGSEVSHTLDPYGKFADTYFWRDVFTIYLVCRGKEPSKEAIQKLADKHEATLEKLVDGAGVGGTCRCDLRAYEKDGERKAQRTWSTL